LRRNVRRTLSSLRALPRARFVYDPRYSHSLSSLPMDTHRAENIAAFLASEGLVLPHEFLRARAVSLKNLQLVHPETYIDSLSQPGALTRVFGFEVPREKVDDVLMLQRLMVGGTKRALLAAIAGTRTAVNIGGGFHHARPTSGHGFCVFNDIAIAIQSARERGFDGPVLVVDLDLHDGDGTRICFAADETVHTFSIHNMPLDEEPAVESTSVTLGGGVGDEVYLAALRAHLPPLCSRFKPQLVIYLAGADPAWDDRIGNWKITEAGMLARDRAVMRIVRSHDPNLPVVILLAGGYGQNAWRYDARFLGEVARGRPVEPPHTEEMTLARMRHLRREHDPLAKENDMLSFTEEDIFGDLGTARVEHRYLGYYTLHMLELALERYGFFERLRGLGYPRPSLAWNLRDPVGHTLKVFGDESHTELVSEVCLRRDRAVISGHEVLYVEWLLLQSPRQSTVRPLLPGQKFPGLGVVGEVLSMLVLMCERLSLDALVFVPGHFHLASLASALMRMLDPEDEARLRALKALQSGRTLAELARVLEVGHVVDRQTDKRVRWEPKPMVFALSDALREEMVGESYEAKVEAAKKVYEVRRRD
jgi:acetoin utilization deacetylase AcuC-like enzyme